MNFAKFLRTPILTEHFRWFASGFPMFPAGSNGNTIKDRLNLQSLNLAKTDMIVLRLECSYCIMFN